METNQITTLQTVMNTFVTALIPVVMAGIGLLSKWIMAKIKEAEMNIELKKDSNASFKDNMMLSANLKILDVISQLTEKSVLALQGMADDLKLAAADGVLTESEKKYLHDKALNEVKELLSVILPNNMKDKSSIYTDELVSQIVDKEIESTIEKLKIDSHENEKSPTQDDINFISMNSKVRD